MTDTQRLSDERIEELKKKLNSTAWVNDADADALVAALDELREVRKRPDSAEDLWKSKREFQEWTVKQGCYNLRLNETRFGYTYHHEITEHAWRGWCQSRLVRQPAAEPAGGAISVDGPLDHCLAEKSANSSQEEVTR